MKTIVYAPAGWQSKAVCLLADRFNDFERAQELMLKFFIPLCLGICRLANQTVSPSVYVRSLTDLLWYRASDSLSVSKIILTLSQQFSQRLGLDPCRSRSRTPHSLLVDDVRSSVQKE